MTELNTDNIVDNLIPGELYSVQVLNGCWISYFYESFVRSSDTTFLLMHLDSAQTYSGVCHTFLYSDKVIYIADKELKTHLVRPVDISDAS